MTATVEATCYDPPRRRRDPVADLGCAVRVFLVITGPHAGQVWTDSRTDNRGIFPCQSRDFADWYEAWLAECETRLLGLVSIRNWTGTPSRS